MCAQAMRLSQASRAGCDEISGVQSLLHDVLPAMAGLFKALSRSRLFGNKQAEATAVPASATPAPAQAKERARSPLDDFYDDGGFADGSVTSSVDEDVAAAVLEGAAGQTRHQLHASPQVSSDRGCAVFVDCVLRNHIVNGTPVSGLRVLYDQLAAPPGVGTTPGEQLSARLLLASSDASSLGFSDVTALATARAIAGSTELTFDSPVPWGAFRRALEPEITRVLTEAESMSQDCASRSDLEQAPAASAAGPASPGLAGTPWWGSPSPSKPSQKKPDDSAKVAEIDDELRALLSEIEADEQWEQPAQVQLVRPAANGSVADSYLEGKAHVDDETDDGDAGFPVERSDSSRGDAADDARSEPRESLPPLPSIGRAMRAVRAATEAAALATRQAVEAADARASSTTGQTPHGGADTPSTSRQAVISAVPAAKSAAAKSPSLLLGGPLPDSTAAAGVGAEQRDALPSFAQRDSAEPVSFERRSDVAVAAATEAKASGEGGEAAAAVPVGAVQELTGLVLGLGKRLRAERQRSRAALARATGAEARASAAEGRASAAEADRAAALQGKEAAERRARELRHAEEEAGVAMARAQAAEAQAAEAERTVEAARQAGRMEAGRLREELAGAKLAAEAAAKERDAAHGRAEEALEEARRAVAAAAAAEASAAEALETGAACRADARAAAAARAADAEEARAAAARLRGELGGAEALIAQERGAAARAREQCRALQRQMEEVVRRAETAMAAGQGAGVVTDAVARAVAASVGQEAGTVAEPKADSDAKAGSATEPLAQAEAGAEISAPDAGGAAQEGEPGSESLAVILLRAQAHSAALQSQLDAERSAAAHVEARHRAVAARAASLEEELRAAERREQEAAQQLAAARDELASAVTRLQGAQAAASAAQTEADRSKSALLALRGSKTALASAAASWRQIMAAAKETAAEAAADARTAVEDGLRAVTEGCAEVLRLVRQSEQRRRAVLPQAAHAGARGAASESAAQGPPPRAGAVESSRPAETVAAPPPAAGVAGSVEPEPPSSALPALAAPPASSAGAPPEDWPSPQLPPGLPRACSMVVSFRRSALATLATRRSRAQEAADAAIRSETAAAGAPPPSPRTRAVVVAAAERGAGVGPLTTVRPCTPAELVAAAAWDELGRLSPALLVASGRSGAHKGDADAGGRVFRLDDVAAESGGAAVSVPAACRAAADAALSGRSSTVLLAASPGLGPLAAGEAHAASIGHLFRALGEGATVHVSYADAAPPAEGESIPGLHACVVRDMLLQAQGGAQSPHPGQAPGRGRQLSRPAAPGPQGAEAALRSCLSVACASAPLASAVAEAGFLQRRQLAWGRAEAFARANGREWSAAETPELEAAAISCSVGVLTLEVRSAGGRSVGKLHLVELPAVAAPWVERGMGREWLEGQLADLEATACAARVAACGTGPAAGGGGGALALPACLLLSAAAAGGVVSLHVLLASHLPPLHPALRCHTTVEQELDGQAAGDATAFGDFTERALQAASRVSLAAPLPLSARLASPASLAGSPPRTAGLPPTRPSLDPAAAVTAALHTARGGVGGGAAEPLPAGAAPARRHERSRRGPDPGRALRPAEGTAEGPAPAPGRSRSGSRASERQVRALSRRRGLEARDEAAFGVDAADMRRSGSEPGSRESSPSRHYNETVLGAAATAPGSRSASRGPAGREEAGTGAAAGGVRSGLPSTQEPGAESGRPRGKALSPARHDAAAGQEADAAYMHPTEAWQRHLTEAFGPSSRARSASRGRLSAASRGTSGDAQRAAWGARPATLEDSILAKRLAYDDELRRQQAHLRAAAGAARRERAQSGEDSSQTGSAALGGSAPVPRGRSRSGSRSRTRAGATTSMVAPGYGSASVAGGTVAPPPWAGVEDASSGTRGLRPATGPDRGPRPLTATPLPRRGPSTDPGDAFASPPALSGSVASAQPLLPAPASPHRSTRLPSRPAAVRLAASDPRGHLRSMPGARANVGPVAAAMPGALSPGEPASARSRREVSGRQPLLGTALFPVDADGSFAAPPSEFARPAPQQERALRQARWEPSESSLPTGVQGDAPAFDPVPGMEDVLIQLRVYKRLAPAAVVAQALVRSGGDGVGAYVPTGLEQLQGLATCLARRDGAGSGRITSAAFAEGLRELMPELPACEEFRLVAGVGMEGAKHVDYRDFVVALGALADRQVHHVAHSMVDATG